MFAFVSWLLSTVLVVGLFNVSYYKITSLINKMRFEEIFLEIRQRLTEKYFLSLHWALGLSSWPRSVLTVHPRGFLDAAELFSFPDVFSGFPPFLGRSPTS